MSFHPESSSPPKRPRLSLQIKTPTTALTFGKSSTALKAGIDLTSPTAFNTLSNAYAAAIENSSPRTARPANFDTPKASKPTSLRLETKNFGTGEYIHPSQRTQTPGPFSITYPDTPRSTIDNRTPTNLFPSLEIKPTADSFIFTPPQSAGSDRAVPKVFTFAANATTKSPNSPRTPRRRTIGSQHQPAPYTHPRSLHSILRNSPLPPSSTAATPATPSRMSLRIVNRAAKRVGYNDPLTQTITTNQYVKSHIDLLAEESPCSATEAEAEKAGPLEFTLAYTGDETRDGGQTPGPFEEMRRRMAESGLETPATRKRKRKEKKRKWEWTITSGEGEEEEEEEERNGRTPLTAMRMDETPITAIRRDVSVSDSDMSEAEEPRYVPPALTDSEMSGRDRWGNGADLEARPRTSQSL